MGMTSTASFVFGGPTILAEPSGSFDASETLHDQKSLSQPSYPVEERREHTGMTFRTNTRQFAPDSTARSSARIGSRFVR